MARLYISQNSKDSELATRIAEGLQKRGHIVSVDVNFLVPGEEWKRRIREESAACDGIVALLTQNSVGADNNAISSQWVAADIGAARAAGKFLIPVILGNSVRIPALVDDLFVVREDADERGVSQAAHRIDGAVRSHMEKRKNVLDLFLPPGFEQLASGVKRFTEDFSFDESVFLMMKFPDPQSMGREEVRLLEDIWGVVDRTLAAYGLRARRADKKTYHDQLWENICIHMLGSRYGIAILEDRAAPELNPNVALEYGFMRALNRQVALIRDIHFKHDRADLTGKLSKPFEIDDSKVVGKDSLMQAVKDWLLDIGIQPRQRV